MWALLSVFGCGSGQKIGQTDVEEPVLEVLPTEIDFGTVPLGQTAVQLLTLRNDGASDALVAELHASSPDVAIRVFASPRIPAGGELGLTLEWSPHDASVLDGTLDLRVGTLGDLSDLGVPLVGTVSGARLTISEQSADLGVVMVGCSETLSIDARNTGTEDLVIDSLELSNDLEFSLEDDNGGALVLPIRIPPDGSAVIGVVYTPTAEHAVSTNLQIESNDALEPETSVRVDGEGRIDASNTMFWTVGVHHFVTAIVQVNDSLLNDPKGTPFAERVRDFPRALFEGLHDAGVSYRLAFVVNENGEVAGDVPYIDESFTLEEAVAAADAMIDSSSKYGDNDQGLETCVNAIEANQSWLLADGDVWRDSMLNLLVINADTEQSPGSVAYYLKLYDEYKDPDDLAVHEISGGQFGCTDGEFSARPSYALFSAVEATGGVSLSICDADWTKSIPALVEGFTGGVLTFVLEGTPAAESIEVRIDGVQIFSGWSYDEKTRAIAFDDATFPPPGSELRVDYRMKTCE